MNKLITILTGGLCILGLSSGIKPEKKYTAITTTPNKLQLFVDQRADPYTIKIAYTLNIPADIIPSCGRLVYQPYFVASGHQYNLTPLVISGQKNVAQEKRLEALSGKRPEYPDAMQLISEGDGMKIRLSEIVPFEVWMAQSKLRADITLERCDREAHVEVLTLADGVIWFPLAPGPVLVKYIKEVTDVPKVAEEWFVYPAGNPVFEREYDGNMMRMKKMMGLIDSLQADTILHLKKIVITGNSSPSGSLSYNTWLARQRAENMKQRFVRRKGLDPRLIELRYVTVDWQGLRREVEQSDIPGKEEVLRILDGKYTEGQREEKLRHLPQYDYLQSHIFPNLQKVTCTFYYTQREEITKIVPE